MRLWLKPEVQGSCAGENMFDKAGSERFWLKPEMEGWCTGTFKCLTSAATMAKGYCSEGMLGQRHSAHGCVGSSTGER